LILEGLAIIINSSSYDRTYYALTIASLSAAQLQDVQVLFTYGAVRRLVKGWVDTIGDETERWIREDLEKGLKEGSIKKISEMITYLKGFGGKIYSCSAAIAFHNIKKDELIEEVDGIMGVMTFLEKTENSRLLYV